jgi:hypothetical protein
MISPEDFDRWVERDRLLQSIEHGLHDSESGNILSDKESKEALYTNLINLTSFRFLLKS